jgi:homogentisate 1,2-dioxygenase
MVRRYINFKDIYFIQNKKHSCFNIVTWHRNYVPCKYDLRKFFMIHSVSFDHIMNFKNFFEIKNIYFIEKIYQYLLFLLIHH